MNDEATPKKKRGFWSRVVPSSRPGKLAVLTALILLLALIGVWVARLVGHNNVVITHAVSPWRAVIEVCLAVLIIPILVYGVAQPSAASAAGQFADIDRAWEMGRTALNDVGVGLSELPLFLILGSSDSEVERGMMEASSLKFKVEGVPHGERAQYSLHWYATADAVYLFCSDVGSTSNLADTWQAGPHAQTWRTPQAPLRRESPPVVSPGTSAPKRADLSNSIDTANISSAATISPVSIREAIARENVGGRVEPEPSAARDVPVSPVAPTNTSNPEIDTSPHSQRLEYLSHLIRKERQPRCGINGVVALIPFEIATAGERALNVLAESVRQDVRTIQRTLELRAPVTAIVTGLEEDLGFSEFVDRLDDPDLARRLGGRFELQSQPTPQELNVHSDRLCDEFEDWIYDLFRKSGALSKQRGNRKLYRMLSRIRHQLKPQLRRVLGKAFEYDPNSQRESDSLLFSGCYFISAGAATGRGAFVKGVLDAKLLKEQSLVQWDEALLRKQALLRLAGNVGWVCLAGLSVGLVGQLLWRWLGSE